MQPSKLADDLKARIEGAAPSDRIRVVGCISPQPEPELESLPKAATRRAFREQMIQSQQNARSGNSAVLAQVEALGLSPAGGRSTGMFYVEASPSQIKRLSDIDGIVSLSLDKRLDLIR
jgi:hypothetical protein